MVQGQVVFKRGWEGGWNFPYLIFLRLSFLHLEITLQNRVMHLKKNYFFLPP